jgi:hypothetical protein
VTLVFCTKRKDELLDLVAAEFSEWADCVNEKSQLLTDMWIAAGSPDPFLDFLGEVRQRYDDLRDDDMVMLLPSGLEIPDILDSCPEDVHQQYSVAESFDDILGDCKSYLAWLKAQHGGFCEVGQFDDILTDNADAAADAAAELLDLLDNLYPLKAEDGEERVDYVARSYAAFLADAGVVPVASGIVIPETSPACPDDARDAHAAAVQFASDLDDALTYNAWLDGILQGCCSDLEADYDGIAAAAGPEHEKYKELEDAYVAALYVFLGMHEADETLEQFSVRYAGVYDATNPLEVPFMSLDTFVDVPKRCGATSLEAAEELVEKVADLNHRIAYVEWMQVQLNLQSDLHEMELSAIIAAINPLLVEGDLEKKKNLDDLHSFQAMNGETMEDFTARMYAEFDAELDAGNFFLEDTPFTAQIPDVPDLAQDETEDLRDEALELNAKLARCNAFTAWLAQEIFVPCDVLRQTFEAQSAAAQPRIDTSDAEQSALLASLKELKDADGALSDEDFANEQFANFELAAWPAASADITVAGVPLVCQQATHDAQEDIQALADELEGDLTYEDWLWDQTQNCCQDLGIEFVAIKKAKEEQRDELVAEIGQLQEDIAAITEETSASLTTAFNAAADADEVDVIEEGTVLTETPEECQ